MRILGIESSSPECSTAILENEKILSQISADRHSSYSGHLLKMVDRVLSESGMNLNDVDGLAITKGPGSFTGLRVGVSLVKGFILSTEKPFVGVDTLEALAALVPETGLQICPILDARKSEVYCAFFSYRDNRLTRLSGNSTMTPETLCGDVSKPTIFVGSGLERYQDIFSRQLGPLFQAHEGKKEVSLAASAATLASMRFEELKSYDLNSLKINYVRKPEAELNYIKKHQT